VRAIARVVAFAALFVAVLVIAEVTLGRALAGLEGPAAFLRAGLTLAAALVAGAILIRTLDGRSAGALGFAFTANTSREIAIGLAIGVGAIAVAVVPMVIAGFLRYAADDGGALDWTRVVGRDLAVLGTAAAAEEALFRGYPFQALVRGFGGPAATAAASAAFGLAHAANPNVGILAMLNIILAGVLLSVAYLRTRSLWFATALHLGWNWGMATLLDLPVSGLDAFETPLYDAVVTGPDWITGGEFGPEGGILGTIGFAAALVAVLRWPTPGVAPRMRELRPLADDHAGAPLGEEPE
jgi:membrane protease YdiL (CAAX protease family)